MLKKSQGKIRPVERRKRNRWGLAPLVALVLAVGLAVSSCGQCKHLPSETATTTVNIKDSTVLHIKDSVRIIEATRYKDLAWLGDSLKIEGTRSRMWAVADTTKEVLIGGLEEEKVEEKTRIVYKDRIEYRDSIQVKEIPVEIEKEKIVKVVPKFYLFFTILGIIFSILSLFKVYLKVKTKFIQ